MNIPTSSKNAFDTGVVTCPVCGHDEMHHIGVVVFDREEDDKQLTITRTRCSITGKPYGTSVMTVPGDEVWPPNPSDRRHGIHIKMWCESCTNISHICVNQHKGRTAIYWGDQGEYTS